MFDSDQDSKTEQATPKQRQKVRNQGQVAKSLDVSSVVSIGGALAIMVVAWPLISSSLYRLASNLLGRLEAHANFSVIGYIAGKSFFWAVGPVVVTVLIFGVASQIAQIGFKVTLKPLLPNFSKLNPFPQLVKLFISANSFAELLKSLAKVAVTGYIAVSVLLDELSNHGRLAGLSVFEVFSRLGDIAVRIVSQVLFALVIIALLDLIWQRYSHSKKIMMTKQDVKEEHKQAEGDPKVKQNIRRKQYGMARARMLDAAGMADVVVVNPTHYSVAIKYNVASDPAPQVVALGVDHLAFKIRDRARQNGVPVVSNPPLARGLHASCEVGGYIPAEFFNAVASLLAWVYSITGRVA